MRPNVGDTDRVARIVAGLLLLGAFFMVESNLRYLALLGIIPLATGLLRWCPLYSLFGLNTCGVPQKSN